MLNETHISEPSLRMVGMMTRQLASEIVCASSSQQMSTPSVERREFNLFKQPLNMNSPPQRDLMELSVISNQASYPRRRIVSTRILWLDSLMEFWNSRRHSTRNGRDAVRR